MLETLEDRITPSPVIENAANAAQLQTDLSNATAANTQYIIILSGASSAYNLTAGQQLAVSAAASGSSVTIAGAQSITGNGNRVFLIDKGANVTLQDLTITGGKVTSTGNAQGGGIFDSGGNVTLSNVTAERSTVMGKVAEGGGIFVTGGGNLTIKDSNINANIAEGVQGANATKAGQNGTAGGSASGGGLYVGGSGWTATLIGDTLLGNLAAGGDGGNGGAGSKATGVNAQGGDGGDGGDGGIALGGAAFFSASANGSGTLTVLNDLATPTTHPSIMISNQVGEGAGGNGGAGGASTGAANNSKGGNGGTALGEGAAVYIGSGLGATLTANIGNTTFFGNKIAGSAGGAGGAAGTGGSGTAGVAGTSHSGFAAGGALALEDGNVTLVNSTVAANLVYAGSGRNGGVSSGGGIYDNDAATVTLDNNTLTQNNLSGAANAGAALTVAAGNPILLNNLIQANYSSISTAADLDTNGATLSNAYNNYIASINPTGSVSAATNIILGDYPALLGGVVGFTANGLPTGGPIYYPLVPSTVSIAAGTTSDLSTIAAVEGTTVANAVDAIGTSRSSNGSTSGTIDLGAVQLRNVTENAADAGQLQTDLSNATAVNTLYTINLTGTSSAYNLAAGQQLTVSSASSVSIVGAGQSITGNGNRVFQVEKGGNLILQNLTITGGTVTSTDNAQGGGIEDLGGNVILSNATVRGNSATGIHADGGGIFVSGNGNLTVQGGSVIESNRAVGGTGEVRTAYGEISGGSAAGGGIYVSANGPGILTIRDSAIRKNSAHGNNGPQASAPGGDAFGGGVYVGGSGWTATLTGDTLSGNSAVGGNGGNGAAGGNATGTNAAGGYGGYGGNGGTAEGGGAYFSGSGIVALKILNDAVNPSLFVDNSVQGGNGGNGGNGGTSTGTAKNANGGNGGGVDNPNHYVGGGALYISTSREAVVDKIGNTTFYGNSVLGGNGGTGGAAGTGGLGAAGSDGTNQNGARAEGGGIALQAGNISMVNCTVAKNTATAGGQGVTLGTSLGGGLFNDSPNANLDNNTITQNKIGPGFGGGVFLSSTNPILVNNLIQ